MRSIKFGRSIPEKWLVAALAILVLFFTLSPSIATAQTPEINVSISSQNIADDPAGDPSTTPGGEFSTGLGGGNFKIYTIENTGLGPLTLGANAVSITGTHAGDFSVIQPPTTIAAGANTTFRITFTPSITGVRGPVDVTIANDDADENPYNFRIQGTGQGVEMNLTGNSQNIADSAAHAPGTGDHTDFGSTDISSGTIVRTFTIENNGFGVFLDLQSTSAVAVTGAHASDFTVTRQPPQLVDVSVPETFEITFNPSATGLRGPVDVTITNDDLDESPYNFRIQGTGINVGVPEIDVTGAGQSIASGDTTPNSTDGTDFGSTATGFANGRAFSISNSLGTIPLTLGTVTFTGANPGDFSIVTAPGASVAVGSSTLMGINFAPQGIGLRTATVNIPSNDPDENPYTFAIQGTGTSVVGSITLILNVDGPDARLDFSSVTTALNFSLISTGGTAQTTIPNIAAGTHVITATDLTAMGYAITAIKCSDSDSTADLTTRTATIVLDPAESVTCTFTLKETRSVTTQMIVDYLSTRNNLILQNRADLTRRLSRLNNAAAPQGSSAIMSTPLGFTAQLPSPVAVSMSQNLLSYAGSARETLGFFENRSGNSQLPDIGNWDIWSEGNFGLFKDNTSQSGNFGVVHVGVDYLVSANVLLGAKVQIDWMDQAFAPTNGKVDGIGFMAGPYATIALGENLFFDISGSWGQSQNMISPFGTYVDHFSTNRWMIDGSLTGQYILDNWTVRPTLAFAYIDEYQNPYTDSLNVPIPGQRIAQGELSFAPHVSYDFILENGGVLTPWLEVKGRYAFQMGGKPSTGSYSDAMNAFSASFGGGFDFNLTSGASFTLSGQYEGIGKNATSYGVDFGVSVPLN